MKFLKIEFNEKQIDLIPVDEGLRLCDGCYGLIEFCNATWQLSDSESVDLVRDFSEGLLIQLRNGAPIASHDIFTGYITEG